MKQPLKAALLGGLIALIAAGAVEASLAQSRNTLFEFCTTKAYGWPAPWRMDYCECGGLKTEYPFKSMLINATAVGLSGLAGFGFCGAVGSVDNF